ncbi:MAG: dUTP diphosphatase [Rickettsiales bacterium]|nr:MAG: dUTP diphosphatase [Rickettsiales bacterium]
MQLNIKRLEGNDLELPSYGSPQSAGFDVRACIADDVVMKPMDRIAIPTGLAIALPEGYEAQARPRSGLALKNGITIINTPGTIDSDYRGELKIILINLSKEDFIIHRGDRIAQIVIKPVLQVEFNEVDELDKTERGEGGFGSTGIK